jgi:alpha-glucosidase
MNLTKQIALKLRFIKLQRFLGSLFYPLQRDWLERQVRSQQSLEVFEETGNLLRAEQIAQGARFYFKQVELEIQFLNHDLVQVDWQPHHPPIPYGIARQDWPEVKITLQEVEAVGGQVVFLPPSSPDLSPIELCWSKLKQLLRSAKARTSEALDQALTKIINECISDEDALGWFAHCGLFI